MIASSCSPRDLLEGMPPVLSPAVYVPAGDTGGCTAKVQGHAIGAQNATRKGTKRKQEDAEQPGGATKKQRRVEVGKKSKL
jgi:hypothetical protein